MRKPSSGQSRNFARWVKARIRIQLLLTSKLVLKLCPVLSQHGHPRALMQWDEIQFKEDTKQVDMFRA